MTLLVFSDDWGRHPTSCQHLIRQLLPQTPVIWVNMIGMRRPKLEWYTVTRGFEKLGQWFRPQSQAVALPDSLQVISPIVWPGFANRLERGLNVRLLLRCLNQVCESLPEPPIVITTMPTVADLVGKLPAKRWVYYCVDDFTTWPGLDHAAVERMENQLIDRVDRIIVVSETLQDRMAKRGRKAELLTHGVDLEFWTKPHSKTVWAMNPPRPWIVFWGLIDRRMDTEFIIELSNANLGSILLVGPEDKPDPRLKSLPRVFLTGSMPREELPALAADAAVLILPYADLPVTQAIQPLKLKEYLASGRPVVSRSLPAVREWADALDLADQPASFTQLVRLRTDTGLPEAQHIARQRLAAESWNAKAIDFARLLKEP